MQTLCLHDQPNRKTRRGDLSARRIAAFLLAVLLAAGALTGCSARETEPEQKAPAVTNADTPAAETEPAVETEPERKPDLPDVTFDGYTFRIYAWNIDGWHTFEDLSVEDSAANALAESVYNRNLTIEDKYDVRIDVIFEFYEDYYNNVVKNTKASEDYADVTQSMGLSAGTLMSNGPFRNLLNLDAFELDAPWWNRNAVEGMTINGYLPYCCSAVTLNDKAGVFCTFYNLDLAEEVGLRDNIYDVVHEGEWTIEKLRTYSEAAASDLNGNGQIDPATDRFGVTGNRTSITAIFAGCGNRFVSINEDDVPVSTFMTERTVDSLVTFLNGIMFQDKLYLNGSTVDIANVHINTFAEDRALCLILCVTNGNNLREMESTYAIVPVPKLNPEQESYYAAVDMFTTYLTSLPITLNTDAAERAAIIWEALSYESYRRVLPVFYDTVIDYKLARDAQSTEMLDIIFDSIVYDIGQIYNIENFADDLTGLDGHMPTVLPRTTDIASFYEKKRKVFERSIDRFYTVCGKYREREE